MGAAIGDLGADCVKPATPTGPAQSKVGHADAAHASAVVLLRRATELSETGAHGPALALLGSALEVHPAEPELHTARGWALENLEPARLSDARAAYETALALDAGQLWARVGLATVLGKLGRSDSCPPLYRDLVEQAAMRAAQEPEFIELLGWCQYRLGRLDEAACAFGRALAIDNAWVSVHFDLGLVRLLLGDSDGALERYRCGLRLLADRGPPLQAGTLKVARDDLDDALRQHPSLAASPAVLRIREQLEGAMHARQGDHG